MLQQKKDSTMGRLIMRLWEQSVIDNNRVAREVAEELGEEFFTEDGFEELMEEALERLEASDAGCKLVRGQL